jgi:hypothetical protein
MSLLPPLLAGGTLVLGVAQLWYAKNEELKNIRLGFSLNVNLQNIRKIATKEGNKIIFAQTEVISLVITTLPWDLQICQKTLPASLC